MTGDDDRRFFHDALVGDHQHNKRDQTIDFFSPHTAFIFTVTMTAQCRVTHELLTTLSIDTWSASTSQLPHFSALSQPASRRYSDMQDLLFVKIKRVGLEFI